MPDSNNAFAAGLGAFGIVGGLIGLALFVFWVIQIVDVVRRDFPEQNTKIIWVLVVILLGWVGAAIYLFAGKPQGTLRS
jgi:hypothetical protein